MPVLRERLDRFCRKRIPGLGVRPRDLLQHRRRVDELLREHRRHFQHVHFHAARPGHHGPGPAQDRRLRGAGQRVEDVAQFMQQRLDLAEAQPPIRVAHVPEHGAAVRRAVDKCRPQGHDHLVAELAVPRLEVERDVAHYGIVLGYLI